MLCSCYLRDYVVYVPTLARRAREPVYTHIEPVGVVSIANTEAVRRTLLETIARKNPTTPDPDQKARDAPFDHIEICGRTKLVCVLSQCVNVEHQRRRRGLQNDRLSQAFQRILAARPRATNPVSGWGQLSMTSSTA
jgi:hypothetical protein